MDIAQFIHHKLYYCSYIGISDEFEVAIVDVHFISTTIEKKDIIPNGAAHGKYRVNFNIDAVFGFKQMQCDTTHLDYETIYQQHLLNLELDVVLIFNDKEGQNFKILADLPHEINVYYDEGEYIDWRNKHRYQ